MKNTYTNKLAVIALVAGLAFLSLSASAGQDGNQRFMLEQVTKLQQQAKVAEVARQQAAAIKQAECMKQMEQGNHASGS